MTEDPYAGLGVPEAADPYQGIAAPAGPPRKSQGLGFLTGSQTPIRNLGKIPSPFDLLRKPLMDMADKGISRYVDSQTSQGVEPGMWGQVAGSMAGTAPGLAVPGGPLLQGAAMGALGSDAKSPMGLAADVGIGAAGGKLGDAAVGMLGRGIGQATRPAVKMLREAGVKLTPGQTFGGKAGLREDRLMSRPVIGPKIGEDRAAGIENWNLGLINESLKPLGVKLPEGLKAGHEAVAFAQKAVHDAYEAVVPKMAVEADQPFIQGVSDAIKNAVMTPKARATALNLVSKQMFPPGSSYTGRALQQVRQTAQRLATKYSTSTNADDGAVGDLLGQISDHLDDLIVRQNPQHAAQFEAANMAHRGQMIIDRAAKSTDDGVFSTGQAKQAALAMDPSKRQAASARGEAFMQPMIKAAREVLPSKTPNSYSADRLMDGKLIPTLTGAGARIGYEARSAMADIASRLPPEAAAFVRRFQKPVGLFGGMAPGAAQAGDRRQ